MGFGENVGDALTFKILTLDTGKILHRSIVCFALDPKAPNKHVNWDKELPSLQPQDLYKHLKSVVMDLEEVDPIFNPKKVSFVDELEKAQPIARRTRSQG